MTRTEQGKSVTHRWAIDRMEEGTAAVEQDGDHMYEIPRFLIPSGAREGDVLAVTVSAAPSGEATITVRVDQTHSRTPTKAPRRAGRAKKDPGGDIAL